MFENFMNLFSRQKSGNVAKDRMQVLLAIDRQKTSVISEDVIEKIREEMMNVISKYLEIDSAAFDVKIERATDENGRVVSTVVANVPINNIQKK